MKRDRGGYTYSGNRWTPKPLYFPDASVWADLFDKTAEGKWEERTVTEHGRKVRRHITSEEQATVAGIEIPRVTGKDYLAAIFRANMKPRNVSMPIGPYCGVRDMRPTPKDPRPISLLVQPTKALIEGIKPHLIIDEHYRYSFEAIIRDDGTTLVTLSASSIIADWWLALFPNPDSLPFFGP